MKTVKLKIGNVLVVVGILLILGVAGRGDFDGETASATMPLWQIVGFALAGLAVTAIGLFTRK